MTVAAVAPALSASAPGSDVALSLALPFPALSSGSPAETVGCYTVQELQNMYHKHEV